jgi:hypothetical protein
VQPQLGNQAIKAWRKGLKECFPKINGILEYQLGQWLYAPQELALVLLSTHNSHLSKTGAFMASMETLQ